ncbi:transglutaminase TgpA family protein [Stratiformator vulcanicus]|uniref:Protein-glutamine gamma-glutamyltransferase n=1 Tax=Stratiformator vulcanicus TaxID=2527980 RepID=A0A517R099_9PLAN|nr:transglutaminaseTgpA domain-containing protein [Stratiformator vulcanicus]QDT37326.1 Protein-glutamine gamma-glutamyltransferase [Stratiformator vulcanicus]
MASTLVLSSQENVAPTDRAAGQPSATLRMVQWHVLAIVCLANFMLSITEYPLVSSMLTIPIAIVAFVVTERMKLFSYSATVANFLSVPALLLCVGNLFSGSVETRIQAGANLLVLLTWVILFQRKESRHYWWLASLAILQIAVGAVLTTSAGFGLLLAVALFLAIRTATYLVALRIEEDCSEPIPIAAPKGESGERPSGRQILVAENRVVPQSSGLQAQIRSAVGALSNAATIVFLGSLFAAAVFFALTPRVWIDRLPIEQTYSSLAGRSYTGYSDTVKLGSFGEVLESPKLVLEVRAFEGNSDNTVNLEAYASRLGLDEPYFRGVTMDSYDQGEWVSGIPETDVTDVPRRPPDEYADQFVRQEIRRHPINASTVFAVHPVGFIRLGDDVKDSRIVRRRLDYSLVGELGSKARNRPYQYVAYSSVDLESAKRHPAIAAAKFSPDRYRFESEIYTRLPPGKLLRLRKLAEEVVLSAVREDNARELADIPASERADRIVRYLRDSGDYTYSLNIELSRSGIDEVEDFLFETRKGHCQYFASALALMLRSVDVPARLVSGFKGGNLNSFTGSYEVQQRHAHAWVEARIDGLWTTLDATPASSRSAIVDANAPYFAYARNMLSVVTDAWQDYVVLLNLEKQKEGFYNPVANSIRSVAKAISPGEEAEDTERTTAVSAMFKALLDPNLWFSGRGIVLLTLLAGCITLLTLISRRVIAFHRRRRRQLQQGRQARTVKFYQRFRELCSRIGLNRPATATEREFLAHIKAAFKSLGLPEEFQPVPVALIDDFYAVRFGNRELSEQRLGEIEGELNALERGIADRQRSGPAKEK